MEREQKLYSIIDTRDENRVIMSNLLGLQSCTLCLELNDMAGDSRYKIEHAATIDNWTDFLMLVQAAHKNHVYPYGYDDEYLATTVDRRP